MPTTRSEASRSKTKGQATTSADWSYQTPTTTAMSSSSATRVASPAKQAGDITTASVRSGIHVAERAAPTHQAAGGTPVATAALLTPAAPAPMDSGVSRVRAEEDSASREGGLARLAEEARQHDEVMARIVEVERRRRARIEEDSHRTQQPQVIDERHASRLQLDVPRDTPLDTDTRSVRSSHRRRAEALAKIAVAKQDLEIAKAKSKLAQAELELLQAESDEEMEVRHETFDGAHRVEQWFDTTKPVPLAVKEHSGSNKTDIQELTSAVEILAKGSRAPFNIDLPHFNGASEEWLAFKRSFEDTARTYSSAQNLTRLRKAVQGKAREAVRSLLFTADNPLDVIAGLEQRFGRPGAIALSELDKLKSLPRVSESPSEICVFASRIRNAVATIRMLGKPQYLYSPETLKTIVDKMPPSMKFRWFAYHQSHKQEETAELVLMDNYLSIESDMCGDFAPPEESTDPKPTKARNATNESSWVSKRDTHRRTVHTVEVEQSRKECPQCKKEHWLTECTDFKKASSDDKWKLVKKERICFKCLKSRHYRIHCKAPTCRTCSRWHHSLLHAEKQQEGKSSASPEERVTSVNNTSMGESRAVYLKMVPVEVYGRTGSARILALMDEGSTITLLESSVAQRIGASGKREPLLLETIGGKEIEKAHSHRVCIKVRGVHRWDKRPIEVRTMDGLNLSSQEVSAATSDGCEHLKGIRDHLVYTRERPQLLIGQDNWGLIVTRRFKKGKKSDPVASLTSLGWTLHGCDTSAITPVNFVNHCSDTRCFTSQEFLRSGPEGWPCRQYKCAADAAALGEERGTATVAATRSCIRIPEPDRFSNWVRLLHATAHVLQSIKLLRMRKKNVRPTRSREGSDIRYFIVVCSKHLQHAEEALMKNCQQKCFGLEIANLKVGKVIQNSSRLKRIDVYLCQNISKLCNGVSSSSMIMALRRMSARTGTLKVLYSDNGTHFVGANRKLQEAAIKKRDKVEIYPTRVSQYGGRMGALSALGENGTSGRINPKTPPEEVLHTLITEIEHIINSRPLTDVSMDPEEEESLTPNHFLLGRSCAAMAPGETSDRDLIGRANWRTAQRLADHFWARWVREYLPLLMPRKITGRDTTDPCTGDIVLVVDATLPRNTWPRGEVIRTYPGPDGRTRMMDVRTPGGVLRRPTRRVVVLVPAAAETTSLLQDGVLRTAGENVSDAS